MGAQKEGGRCHNRASFLPCILFMSGMVLVPPISHADSDELKEALSGFDEVISEEKRSLDDALLGFDEESSINTSRLTLVKHERSPLQISGQIRFNSNYAYSKNAPIIGDSNYQGFTKLQLAGLVEFDYKISTEWQGKLEIKGFVDPIYNQKGRYYYSKDSLSTYESELEVGEGYVLGSLTDNLDIKIGRQIVVWGKSDSLRVTDVINPLDNRELGLVDIENLRLPVLMTRLDYYYSDWQVSLLAQHEHRDPKEAAINSEYFPSSVLPVPSGVQFPDILKRPMQLDETTLSFAVNGRFVGWDLSLYGGRFKDSRWSFVNNKTEREYGLFNMVGTAANVLMGAWLLKAELALLNGLAYNTVEKSQDRMDLLLGLEYNGIADTAISLEVVDRYLTRYTPVMKNLPDFVDEHELQTALRVLYNFNHDRATLGYLGQYLGNTFEKGGFHRIWLEYELMQSINLTGGLIDYLGGKNPMFEAMKNNDKLFFEVQYFF